MRPLLIPLLAAFISVLVMIQPAAAQQNAITDLAIANQVMEDAHAAFERGDFSNAMREYVRVAEAGYEAPQVWTNAGTAAYRAGQIGRAVLYYQRATRLNPEYGPALESLAVVSPATNEGDDAAASLMRRVFRYVPTSGLVIAAQLCFLIFCLSSGKAIAATNRESRGHWVASLAWSLAFTVGIGGVAYYSHSLTTGGNEAVVIQEGAIIRSEPNADSVAKLEVPSGTIVQLTENARQGFIRVQMRDGRSGFVTTETVEKI